MSSLTLGSTGLAVARRSCQYLGTKVVNNFIVKTANVVNFFTVTTGKQIQCQVVKKFIDIHNSAEHAVRAVIDCRFA